MYSGYQQRICETDFCNRLATRLVIYKNGQRTYLCAACLEQVRGSIGSRIRLIKALAQQPQPPSPWH
jgi:hypothetical protein